MCDTKYSILNARNFLIYPGRELKVASVSLFFAVPIINTITIVLIYDVDLNDPILGLLIVLQLFFETISSLCEVTFAFCSATTSRSATWFDVLLCHMWSSMFLGRLIISLCKQNKVNMAAVRLFKAIHPRKDLMNYQKTMTFLYFITFLCSLILSMGSTLRVHINEDGVCVTRQIDETDPYYVSAEVFKYMALVFVLILPAIFQIISFIIIAELYRRRLHKKSVNVFVHPDYMYPQLQKMLDLLVFVWCLDAVLINLIDVTVFFTFRKYGFSFVTQMLYATTDLVRAIFYVLHAPTMFILITQMRSRFLMRWVRLCNACSNLLIKIGVKQN